jgi:hypothetical protein
MNGRAGAGFSAVQLAQFDPYSGCMGFSSELISNITSAGITGLTKKCINYMPDAAFSTIEAAVVSSITPDACNGRVNVSSRFRDLLCFRIYIFTS